MPGLGVVPKPRISAGFKTAKSPGLSMPKPPAMPKAGRLSPTGGRIGGVPGKMAPRVPGPAKPPAVPGLASKSLLTNARRANGKWGFKATPLAQVLGKAPYKRKPGHVMPVGGDFMKGLPSALRGVAGVRPDPVLLPRYQAERVIAHRAGRKAAREGVRRPLAIAPNPLVDEGMMARSRSKLALRDRARRKAMR